MRPDINRDLVEMTGILPNIVILKRCPVDIGVQDLSDSHDSL